MTRFSHDDDNDKVVHFLSQHRPIPPTPSPQLEKELMKRIEQEPMDSQYSYHWIWILPSAMIAILLMVWGSFRWLSPSPQIANNSQDLETFLVDSWTETIGDTYYPSYTFGTNNTNLYWLALGDSQRETYSSNR